MKWEDLDEYRLSLGASRPEFAEVIGVSAGAYSSWKNRGGVPRPVQRHVETMQQLNADVLVKVLRAAKARL